jgi:hypothetical protein
MQLIQTGSCSLAFDEALFDYDHPGHYFRRLRSVALTVPCVSGPYAGVNATLQLNTATVRIKPPIAPYHPALAASPPGGSSFVSSPAPATASIATSSGQNDAGLFEVNLRDERWLPFEGQGAISTWTLVLDPRDNGFDFSTITDVVVHVRYSARADGGDPEAVRKALKPTAMQSLLVSARHAFSDAYYSFFNPADLNATAQTLALALSENVFPFSKLGDIRISAVGLYLFLEQAPAGGTRIDASFGPAAGAGGALQFVPMPGSTAAGDPITALGGDAVLAMPAAPQAFTLTLAEASIPASLGILSNGHTRLDPAKIVDLVLVIDYVVG